MQCPRNHIIAFAVHIPCLPQLSKPSLRQFQKNLANIKEQRPRANPTLLPCKHRMETGSCTTGLEQQNYCWCTLRIHNGELWRKAALRSATAGEKALSASVTALRKAAQACTAQTCCTDRFPQENRSSRKQVGKLWKQRETIPLRKKNIPLRNPHPSRTLFSQNWPWQPWPPCWHHSK